MSSDQLIENNKMAGELKPSYQVVARRYRPQGFDKLIGQEHIAKALIGAIENGRVGHAYLFTGARGVGKTSSARILAKALNCIHGPTPTPCNECDICNAITAGDDIDVLEIDGASNRGIDEIRQLRLSATIRPSRARYKIYIIDEVHMLTREAFNALLKILEEPPEHVKFIFCTTEPNKLPITILSRCQRFDFAGINAKTIADHLRYIAQNEGVAVEDGVAEMLARRANGSMRDAQSLLEQLLSFAPDRISLADVNSMLGTVDDQKIFDLINAVKDENPAAIFPVLAKAAGEGVDFGVLLEQMVGTFRDLLVVSCGSSEDALLYCGIGRYGELKSLAEVFGIERILASMQIIAQTLTRMRYSTQGQILAEMALVRLSTLKRLTGAVQVIEQLKNGQIQGPILVQSAAGGGLPAQSDSPQKKTADRSRTVIPGAAESRIAAVPSVPIPDSDPESSNSEEMAAEKPSLSSFEKTELLSLWRKAADRLGLALSVSAKSCSKIDWNGNILRVGFAPSKDRDRAFDHCQNESKKIAEALSLFVSDQNIHFDYYRTDEPVPVPAEKPKPRTSISKFEEIRKKIDHPMVKSIMKTFGGKLEEVQTPRFGEH